MWYDGRRYDDGCVTCISKVRFTYRSLRYRHRSRTRFSVHTGYDGAETTAGGVTWIYVSHEAQKWHLSF